MEGLITPPKPLTPHQLAVLRDMQAGWILSEGETGGSYAVANPQPGGPRYAPRRRFWLTSPSRHPYDATPSVKQVTHAALLAHGLIERGETISDGNIQRDINKPWLLTAKGKEWA